MAKKKAKKKTVKSRTKKQTRTTAANTGLSIARNGKKFTASWKIACKNPNYQEIAYRTYNGKKWSGWKYKKISTKATSYSFTLSNTGTITAITFRTRIRAATTKTSKTSKNVRTTTYTSYKVSSWSKSSATYKPVVPPVPSLSVSSDEPNKTTFTWSVSKSDTNTAWYYASYYQTKCSSSSSETSGWGSQAAAGAGTYTYTDTETNVWRMFRIRSKGPRGYSSYRVAKRYIGRPPAAGWQKNPASYTTVNNTQYAITCNATISGSTYTVDKIIPQYLIDTPAADLTPNESAGWTDGPEYLFANGKSAYALSVTTDRVIGIDECMWVRVKTVHDDIDSYSPAIRMITGNLTAPVATVTINGTPNKSGFSVTINIDDAGTDVPGAYQKVYLRRNSSPDVETWIGDIPSGTTEKTITSAQNLTNEKGYAILVRNVSADAAGAMKSKNYEHRVTMPTPPTLKSVTGTQTEGKVYLQWQHNWAEAIGTVIAWTDDPDSWQSNNEPEEYEIEEAVSSWYISGLETGKRWYFRVQSTQTIGDNVTKSSWSEMYEIDLATPPETPVLYLSEEAITETGMVTAYWTYITTDGTSQVAGEIVTAENKAGSWAYGKPIGSVTNAQHLDIYAKEQGWKNGTVVNLALRTRAGSGSMSEYSQPVQLAIAAMPTVSITETTLADATEITEHMLGDGVTVTFDLAHTIAEAPTVMVNDAQAEVTYEEDRITFAQPPADDAEIDITYKTGGIAILDDLPMTATITSKNAATLSLVVERASDYPMLRPDGETTTGAAGETIYIETAAADETNTLTISQSELIGHLDDGAYYNLIATASDTYGQTAEQTILFMVSWRHQAWFPSANFVVDGRDYVAHITPIADEGYMEGDTCDIYRLGIDKPELVRSGAVFGEEYVDPYPAFGPLSGYKIVTVTKYGDYITPDSQIADFDTREDDAAYGQLDPDAIVIDFEDEQIELPYNITLSGSWEKDFERTRYLGGHITGDHNLGVLHDVKASTVLVSGLDEEEAAIMRDLARYEGLCHVRTPEGSSLTADVQVSEERSYDSTLISFSLAIQRVDSTGFDAVTAEEWEEMNE